MKIWKYVLGFLALTTVAVWLAFFSFDNQKLHLIACNVGEGDAILVSWGETQILTDGGGNNQVLDCLGKYLPFYDKEIELVILTHPDKDHFGGLIEVLRRYRVDNFLYNPVKVSSQDYQALEKLVGGKGVRRITAQTGQVLRIGLIHLDILNAADEIAEGETVAEGKTNEISIVTLLTFVNFRALLTADMPSLVSDKIAEELKVKGEKSISYLKVPHHGSKYNLTETLLKIVKPEIAVISVGKNPYGHPAEEILKMLQHYNIKIMRTDEKGDIEVVTDGRSNSVISL